MSKMEGQWLILEYSINGRYFMYNEEKAYLFETIGE